MAEDRQLPGWPKKKLVKEVRRHLSFYGIRPSSIKLWQQTWAWANQITQSYIYPRWPLPSEIGAQYVLLLLLEMNANRNLKLPYRAMQECPPSLRQAIEGNPPLMIGMRPKEVESHVASTLASKSKAADLQGTNLGVTTNTTEGIEHDQDLR